MYLLVVLGLMAILPIASIYIEAVTVAGSDFLWLIGKWFVFWAAGIRLLLAGIRQIAVSPAQSTSSTRTGTASRPGRWSRTC